MLPLTTADAACLPSDHIVLGLHSTKTGRGRVQGVSPYDPLVSHWLRLQASPQATACPVTASAVRGLVASVPAHLAAQFFALQFATWRGDVSLARESQL